MASRKQQARRRRRANAHQRSTRTRPRTQRPARLEPSEAGPAMYQGRIITSAVIEEMRADDPPRANQLDEAWAAAVLEANRAWVDDPSLRGSEEQTWAEARDAFPEAFSSCGCGPADHVAQVEPLPVLADYRETPYGRWVATLVAADRPAQKVWASTAHDCLHLVLDALADLAQAVHRPLATLHTQEGDTRRWAETAAAGGFADCVATTDMHIAHTLYSDHDES